jgi:hypothetical protein
MALKESQVYKCPDPSCRCEITVTALDEQRNIMPSSA